MKITKWFLPIIALFVYTQCKRDIEPRNLNFKALNPSRSDTNAGSWKPILLTSPNEFAIATPIAISAADYKLELLEIKSAQNKLTKAEENQIKYWGAGTVLRWNEIMRELVAKYNLPPYQNADGTYPVPNAANPLAYPTFPFANPPYAARAYAYLSTAQYDALIAANFYKNVYKRPLPSVNDPSIQTLLPIPVGYAYPSAEAVAAGASAAILNLLFPGEQEFIQQKLNECKNVRILAGLNTRSETEAGALLGKAVAGKFINRARNDKAGKAGGSLAAWAKLESDAIAQGRTPWKSVESPLRPPMLPFFGNTMGFLVDTLEIAGLRPSPPPAENSDLFKKELAEVKWYSEHPSKERIKIVHFWADGIATLTPPGHWNMIAAEDFVQLNFSEVRWARNLALLNMSMFDAAICCWETKYFYFVPRPSQIDPKIKTLTGLPNFPAYTSGHSSFSGAAATFLGFVNPANAGKYTAMAKEASDSRLFGAIHYRSDIEVGLQIGNALGARAITKANADGAN